MTVAFIVPRLESGGAEHVMRVIAESLQKRGGERIILLSILDRPLVPGQEDGVETICLGCKRTLSALPRLAKVIVKERVDVVVSTLPHVIRAVSILKLLGAGRFYHIARLANTYSQQLKHTSRRLREPLWLTRVVNRGVDRFIAVSKGVRDDYVNAYGVSLDKISIINNPVKSICRTEACSAGSTENKGKRILMVGRLVKQKNVGLALRAFKLFKKRYGENDRLSLLGDGPERGSLKVLAQELGVSDSVDFEGFQRDTAAFYRSADVFLLTSLYEGFPNVVLEALAHGVPVVSVDCPSGPSDILVKRELGVLTSYDEGQIVEALARCLNELSQVGKKEVRQKFVQDTYSIERISDLYNAEIQVGLGARR